MLRGPSGRPGGRLLLAAGGHATLSPRSAAPQPCPGGSSPEQRWQPATHELTLSGTAAAPATASGSVDAGLTGVAAAIPPMEFAQLRHPCLPRPLRLSCYRHAP